MPDARISALRKATSYSKIACVFVLAAVKGRPSVSSSPLRGCWSQIAMDLGWAGLDLHCCLRQSLSDSRSPLPLPECQSASSAGHDRLGQVSREHKLSLLESAVVGQPSSSRKSTPTPPTQQTTTHSNARARMLPQTSRGARSLDRMRSL
ncbi:hypothetical protein F5883DRAFT_109853 [Diaporthe sp. PMI_573]|jgi:hypothetical protein|nr:hypothetical protein F5883DRAFT_109853 [Diaporthaceae sp. PMI_573]